MPTWPPEVVHDVLGYHMVFPPGIVSHGLALGELYAYRTVSRA